MINSKKKLLTISKDLSENLSLKFLCDVIFQSLSGQSDIPGLTMSNFCLGDNHWQRNFSNHTKFKQKTSKYIQRLVAQPIQYSMIDNDQFSITWVPLEAKLLKHTNFNGAFSGLRQFLATKDSLKMMKNAFYFTKKALHVLKIFQFLSWLFGHVEKQLD